MNANMIAFIVLPVFGYLLGAIPFGLLIGFSKGIDVRKGGSGNIGSTNVGRLLGKKWGYLCFLLDVVKGLIPVMVSHTFLRNFYQLGDDHVLPIRGQWVLLSVAVSCIFGHMFSLYIKFRGGKGVATTLGAVLGIWPFFTLTGVVVFVIWVAIWGWLRYVSLASIVAAVSFPVIFMVFVWRMPHWSMNGLWPFMVFSCFMGALVIIRHRSNIARLLAGTENRGGKP